MVAYHFPPAGGPGVQRPLKFAKYLPQYGWCPMVLTVRDVVELGQSATVDRGLATEMPPEGLVVRTESLDPYRLLFVIRSLTQIFRRSKVGDAHYRVRSRWFYRPLKWLQRLLFFPDDRLMWLPFATLAGVRLPRLKPIDVLWTTFPPGTTALVGLVLKRALKLPWVLDLRDLWLDDPFTLYPTRLHRWLTRSLERLILQRADAIIVLSETMKDMMEAKVNARGRVYIIPNGFDLNDFRNVPPKSFGCYTIVYSGSLYWHNVRPFICFLDALKILADVKPNLDLKVVVVGRALQECINAVNLRKLDRFVEFTGFVPHRESISFLLGADLALLLIDDRPGSSSVLTGKVYEYIGSGTPVLAIAPEGDAASLIRATSAGTVVGLNAAAVAQELRRLLDCPLRKQVPGQRGAQYERRYLARELARVLDVVQTSAEGKGTQGRRSR